MAREVRNFAITVLAGTPIASPQVSDLSMPPRIVRHVRVRIPPGPRGVVGWALGAAGVPVLPWGTGQWVVADDEVIEWDLQDQIDSGAWQLRAYNTGAFDHALYVTFQLDPVGSGSGAILSGPLVINP